MSPDATVFAHNRPGYANSAASAAPRDGATIVEQLRAVLRQKALAPPYVLVGHSLGGLYMQLFARRYPHEVKGIVLVDSLYPRIVKKPEDFPFATRMGKWPFSSDTVQREIVVADSSQMQLTHPELVAGAIREVLAAPSNTTPHTIPITTIPEKP